MAAPEDVETRAPAYRRYQIETAEAKGVVPHPSRFRVHVKRLRLLSMVLHELLVEHRGHPQVALSRPCVYGVFGRVVGGLLPRHELCVGCLRCQTQYPEMVRVVPNPARAGLGDAYLTPDRVDTILYEARTGRVPVRGAGYRGAFGGTGWDSMWTDMSEIVRPTRDGIHGREFISTAVDLGALPSHLCFVDGKLVGDEPHVLSLPVPLLFDVPAPCLREPRLLRALAEAARAVESLAILPARDVVARGLHGPHVAPLLVPADFEAGLLDRLPAPRLLELAGWDPAHHEALRRRFPQAIVVVRVPMDADLAPLVEAGARVFHLTADYHGRRGGRFALELIREAHERLLAVGRRDEVTLLGSGGIAAAEHVPKAILVGLDAVALDTPAWVALQAQLAGECADPERSRFVLPPWPEEWAVQRLANLTSAWRDQLLEVLGAMGLREVRRLRGELGRAMFQQDLEREAFSGIEGYGS